MTHLLLAAALATVTIDDFTYRPSTLTVTAGQTVRFLNDDQEAHTITSTSGIFDSAGVDTHGTWTYTFKKPGRYTYYCELHPYMKGTIIVLPARKTK
jgi:plastocyanin